MSRHVEYCAQCDCCGRDGCHAANGHDVRRNMRQAGWLAKRVIIDGRHALADICSSCLAKDREDATVLATETIERKMRIAATNEPVAVGGVA